MEHDKIIVRGAKEHNLCLLYTSLESDIKEFGSYKADVKLYSGIVANITVKVSEA